jgi:hypothetical protein
MLRVIVFLMIILEVPFLLKGNNPTTLNFSFNNLTINGKSNINNFSFYFDNNSESLSHKDVITKKNIQKTEFLLPVEGFRTINKCIQNDFLKMIQADKFPYICFTIDNNQMELLTAENKCDSINATITIAQESKQFYIPVKKGLKQENDQYIIGNIELLLTDFNLVPLSKLFGLIKVENSVTINFRINFVST